jgi:23S rRNA pseudouridine2605 synthase
LVNSEVATPGRQVDPKRDRITVDGRPARLLVRHTYLAVNKPVGVLSAASDPRGRRTVVDLLDRAQPAARPRLYPVGRLDLPSRGLVLLTDDGELAVRVMHPRYHVQKEYRVRLRGRPSAQAMARVREGMTVGDERFQPASIVIDEDDGDQVRLTMVLTEGRKREVRRIWRALGHPVLDLERVRIGPLRLGRLQPGAQRELSPAEVRELRRSAGLA